MTNEYKKAKLHFGNHSFRQAAQIIETVNHFEENHSFLFLWGYSMYMVVVSMCFDCIELSRGNHCVIL